MAKSIRSKVKRQHRAEFRRTIGGDAYKVNMDKVQAKLKDNLEKQSMTSDSLERLSNMLGSNEPDDANAAMDDTAGDVEEIDERGENKATVSKKSRMKNKHSLRRALHRKEKVAAPETKTYKYHCAF